MGLFLALTGLYVLLSTYVVYFWQQKPAHPYPVSLERFILATALLLQFIWGIQHIYHGGKIILGMSSVLTLVTWIMLTWYWLASFYYKLQGLQLLLFPISLLALLVYYFFPGNPIEYTPDKLPLLLHIIVSILAYSLFGVAAILSVLIWRLSSVLHSKRQSAFINFLPPLLSLETYMFQLYWVGFGLLTLSLISGILFPEYVFRTPLTITHKMIFGGISWLIFAILLFGRIKYHWRGKTAAQFILAGFFFLALTYTGTHFVLEFILPPRN